MLLLKKYWFLITLAALALVTVIINQFPVFIEKYYATGLFLYISRTSRFLLGWIPFSIGDVMYVCALIWIIVRVVNFFKRWKRNQLNRRMLYYYGRRILQTALLIYIAFNWLWGFNYNRLGSAYQMNLRFERYSNAQLERLTDSILSKLNSVAGDTVVARPGNSARQIATLSLAAYNTAELTYPFLHHQNLSVKPGLFYGAGNYIGFLGYINPFTAEAQLNTTIPQILLPYVCCHEMAHQLGYASESEANFVGYLACCQSKVPAFRYSVYLDLFSYVISDLYHRDSVAARLRLQALTQPIKDDRKMVRSFFISRKNPFSPVIDWLYDRYLKMNSQPKGKDSYNEVVGWLVAYATRYGWDKI
ncbi:MAG: DUF3810 domain-containing protein [Chitinophagaceae bacterium]